MRRGVLVVALGAGLLGGAEAQTGNQAGGQAGSQDGGPPHAWVFGSWTGGNVPPAEPAGHRCTAQPSVIFTRDVVMRAPAFDVAYRQRLIETVAAGQDSLEFRFVPAPPQQTPFGPRLPPDIGFGCAGNPNLLRVERIGPNEIRFPDCAEFPMPLKRCLGN